MKLYTIKTALTVIVASFTLFSCQKKNDLNNIWGVSPDKDIFFTISFNGKTLTSYGAKFSMPNYQDWAFDFLFANTSTFTGSNQTVTTETDIFISPLYNELYNWGQFGLADGQVEANLYLVKAGTILGTHNIDDIMFNRITDRTNGNIRYEVVSSGSSVTITEVTDKIIRGTFALNLKLGSQITPATGSFRIWRLN